MTSPQNTMSPAEAIKVHLMRTVANFTKNIDDFTDIDEEWEALEEDHGLADALYCFRDGEIETNIPAEYSRHYESKSVATKLSDGLWVGWTYWYGGGKHGEPEAVDWLNEAYWLDVVGERVITEYIFAKHE